MKATTLLRHTALVLGMAIPCHLSAQNMVIKLIGNHDPGESFRARFSLKNGQTAPFPRPAAAARKTTVMNARLVGFYTLEHNGTSYAGGDSSRLFWSGTRGGNFNYPEISLNLSQQLGSMPPQSSQLRALEYIKTLNYDSSHAYGWNNTIGAFDTLETRTINVLSGNLLQSTTSLSYDGGTGMWENNIRSTVTYDAGNKLTMVTSQGWDGAVWENSGRTSVGYDPSNHPTDMTYANWNTGSSSWDNNYRNVFTYTGNDLATDTYQQWSTSWDNDSRRIFTYDNGQWVTLVEQDWNGLTSSWDNSTRVSFTYDANGHVTQRLEQDWPLLGSNWENDRRYIYAYDASGNITSLTEQDWDGAAWDNDSRTTYSYSSSGSGSTTTQAIMQSWNTGSSSWENEDRMTVQFNEYDKATEITYHTWDAGGFWDLKNGDDKYVYMYETFDDGTTGVDNIARETGFRCYPNPSSTMLTVESNDGMMEDIRILDLTGRTVFGQKITTDVSVVTVPTVHLAPGMYLLQVRHGGKMESVSVMVQR